MNTWTGMSRVKVGDWPMTDRERIAQLEGALHDLTAILVNCEPRAATVWIAPAGTPKLISCCATALVSQ